jgi:hypothetical protein
MDKAAFGAGLQDNQCFAGDDSLTVWKLVNVNAGRAVKSACQ